MDNRSPRGPRGRMLRSGTKSGADIGKMFGGAYATRAAGPRATASRSTSGVTTSASVMVSHAVDSEFLWLAEQPPSLVLMDDPKTGRLELFSEPRKG